MKKKGVSCHVPTYTHTNRRQGHMSLSLPNSLSPHTTIAAKAIYPLPNSLYSTDLAVVAPAHVADGRAPGDCVCWYIYMCVCVCVCVCVWDERGGRMMVVGE
jgi:hypothetical protein